MGLSFFTFLFSFLSFCTHFSSVNPQPLDHISLAPSPAPQPAIMPKIQSSPPRLFNVMSFGSVGDGVTDDTQGFKMAWDSACQNNEPTVLLVPKHYTFLIQSSIFTGSCRNSLVFQIEGTIMAPDGPRLWPKGMSMRQWLVFYRVNGISLQGGGVIDGRGEKWWDLPCKPHKGPNGTTLPGPCDSPVAIRFFMSTNVTVKGVKVKNSPQFNFRFDGCHGVYIDSVNIKAPSLSPNTDGIHIENTDDVRIYNTLVSNGDDCVSIGAGSYNVDIKNITCGPSHGISIGSLGMRNTRACVSNITVMDSVIKHSDNGVRIKTWQGGFGSVSNVRFINIHMDTVRNPVMIDQYYCQSKGMCPNQTSAVRISDIIYERIWGTYDVRSPAMHLGCSDTIPCTNLTFSEVELMPSQGLNMASPFCWNAYGVLQTLTIPPVFCLLEGNPDSLPNTDIVQC
ncbi:polygalacturonase At1g48100-like [Cynara cardunculus var. scolymus]|uniref:Glycoside hydrolase, family 28 n=1 Tax=Cynara cardunculus var. scolymus TaxID=59895 RepID=A0A103Y386_CYNCS|nr:polygalacturonase At1g48100-like [Cynara cardunculus var. scolymus]KVI01715.1 Glycoside hydrolase, family 28 [Cynara cardunculus var. scolymus]